MRTLQDIQPGMTLGRYEFLVPIAEGGMASVWAARLKGSRGFSKTVAVKTMLPGISDDPQFEEMFLDEAQIAARIRHPNVVEILDLGEQDEVLYLVMEWVDGEPLANLRRHAAKQGGIPRSIAVRLIADASAGLHAAHELRDEQGAPVALVHRDISPQNILITYDGVVKIVDFGVAKAAGRSSQATTAGQVKGKPPYMSPEQALGEVVDRRTDVFALGIILYQLTTGKHPFRGESDLVTLQNIVSDKPILPPRAHDKAFPRLLDQVVLKAIDRDRDKRFQTCADLEAALDEVFAKELARARTEDVGKFVTAMLGHRGEERRKSLKEAIRLADERATGRVSASDISVLGQRTSLPNEIGPGTPVSSNSISKVEVTRAGDRISAPAGSEPSASTPFDATVIPPKGSTSKVAVLAGVGALALLLAGVVLLGAGGGDDDNKGPVTTGATPTPLPEPVANVEPPKVEEPKPPVEPSVAAPVEPAATAEEEAPAVAKGPRVKHVKSVAPTSTKRTPKPAGASSATTAATATTVKKSGFVPPPMTNPGF